ncbi:vacuolar protein sorting-associated protein 37A-like [Ptychodera flava]|uniref:vacuolar protein sorting-associated protein 37A-like n=1 Tax=Ptychodera flava TaxID=63121 RepID=UPI00396A8DB0
MAWLFGKSKSNLPPATHLQHQRTKQIESLKQVNRNVTEIQRDVEYRVTTTTGGSTISLNIILPPSFPQEKPIVKVSPPLRHHWVNEQMIVTGCPSINNFGVHTDLGRTVCSIILEFTNKPPIVFGQEQTPQSSASQLPYQPQPHAPAPYPAYPINPVAMATAVSSSPSSSAGGSIPSNLPQMPMPTLPVSSSPVPMSSSYIMPPVPNSFPELRNKTTAELKELNDDKYKIIQYFGELPQVKKLQTDRQDLCNASEDIAKSNIRKGPNLESKKEHLLQKYDELTDLRREFDINCQKQQQLNERYNPGAILTNLRVASMEAEEESDKIADLFLEKKLDIDTFVQQFMDKRKLSHERKGKEEKLQQMLQVRY